MSQYLYVVAGNCSVDEGPPAGVADVDAAGFSQGKVNLVGIEGTTRFRFYCCSGDGTSLDRAPVYGVYCKSVDGGSLAGPFYCYWGCYDDATAPAEVNSLCPQGNPNLYTGCL